MKEVKENIIEEIDYKDKYIRLYAEFENYKKRIIKDTEALVDKIKIEAVNAIIPLYESVTSAASRYYDSEEGVALDMIESQLITALSDLGVEKIPTNGEFDPIYHYALTGKGTKILTEAAPGFRFKETKKVIRPATVIMYEG